MTALAVVVLVAGGAFILVTSGALVPPRHPRSGPEAWIVEYSSNSAQGHARRSPVLTAAVPAACGAGYTSGAAMKPAYPELVRTEG